MALGTFKPGFDPYSYSRVYGDDAGNLLQRPAYNNSVADGNFRPIVSGPWSGSSFAGSGNATGIEGQGFWLLLYDGPNPNLALHFAIFTGSSSSWFAPADIGTSSIAANTGDTFLFGRGGHGSPIILNVMPFPEPSSALWLSLIAVGASQRRLHPRER